MVLSRETWFLVPVLKSDQHYMNYRQIIKWSALDYAHYTHK